MSTMTLSESVALGVPSGVADRQLTTKGVVEAKAGIREVEVCLGVGAAPAALPARVLAHAACVADVIGIDIPKLIGTITRIRIFSSAPKTKVANGISDLAAITTFALSLRKCGVLTPILLELANAENEIPCQIDVTMTEAENAWLTRASNKSGNGADPRRYALEHAATSMFGDIDQSKTRPFRISVGAVPEATFWAIRNRVRSAALACGLSLAPAVALVLRSCRLPWYSPTLIEPSFASADSIEEAIQQLDLSANPARGGNTGVKREARALRRFAGTGIYQFLRDAQAGLLVDIGSFTRPNNIEFGPNARRLITTGGMK